MVFTFLIGSYANFGCTVYRKNAATVVFATTRNEKIFVVIG